MLEINQGPTPGGTCIDLFVDNASLGFVWTPFFGVFEPSSPRNSVNSISYIHTEMCIYSRGVECACAGGVEGPACSAALWRRAASLRLRLPKKRALRAQCPTRPGRGCVVLSTPLSPRWFLSPHFVLS